MVEAQLDTLAVECVPRAVKTGALANAAIVKAVARAIERLKLPAPVVDPVIVSSSGALLIGPKGERAIRKRLIPIARIVTPNIAEAEVLTRIRIDSDAAIREAAIKIIKLGARAVVIKGGHRKDNSVRDGFVLRRPPLHRAQGPANRGRRRARHRMRLLGGDRGASRARRSLEDAVRGAKSFVTTALKHSFKLGKGRALLDHFARG